MLVIKVLGVLSVAAACCCIGALVLDAMRSHEAMVVALLALGTIVAGGVAVFCALVCLAQE